MFWQIVFEGIVGKSYQGDIAIDDLKLIKSPCPLPGDYFVLFNLDELVYFPLSNALLQVPSIPSEIKDCTPDVDVMMHGSESTKTDSPQT